MAVAADGHLWQGEHTHHHHDTHHADAEDDADTDPHHHAVLVQAVAQTAYLHKFGVERGVE